MAAASASSSSVHNRKSSVIGDESAALRTEGIHARAQITALGYVSHLSFPPLPLGFHIK
jgi:hypothetical protein